MAPWAAAGGSGWAPGVSPWAGVGRSLAPTRPRDGPRHAARALPSVSRSAQVSHPPSSLPWFLCLPPKSYSLSQRPLVLFLLLALTSPPPCPTQPSVASPDQVLQMRLEAGVKGPGRAIPHLGRRASVPRGRIAPVASSGREQQAQGPFEPGKIWGLPMSSWCCSWPASCR